MVRYLSPNYGHQRSITAADKAMVFQFHKKSSCNFFSRTFALHTISFLRPRGTSFVYFNKFNDFNNVNIFKNKAFITKLFQLIIIINYSLYMTKTVICGPVWCYLCRKNFIFIDGRWLWGQVACGSDQRCRPESKQNGFDKIMILHIQKLSNCWNYNFKTDR